jgi:hypothetical protein
MRGRDPHRSPTPDLATRIELRPDPIAAPGNVVPLLARLLRRLRDRERERRRAAEAGGATGQGGEDGGEKTDVRRA